MNNWTAGASADGYGGGSGGCGGGSGGDEGSGGGVAVRVVPEYVCGDGDGVQSV